MMMRMLSRLGLAAALVSGCFDSDQKFKEAQTTGEDTTGDSTTMIPDPTTSSTGLSSSSSGEPPATCRDAIRCVQGCAATLAMSDLPEPDLSCFLDCEEGLTVPEALDLLRLANCASEQCAMQGVCAEDTGTGSSSGGTTGDAGSSSSSGSSSTTDGGEDPDIPPCLECVFVLMDDPQPPGCQEFADACE